MTPNQRRASRSLILLALLAASSAMAGGTAVMEAGDGKDRSQVQFEFDGDKLRMSTGVQGEGESYGIFRDGKMYTVSISNGKPMVIDTSAMMKMMGKMVAEQAASMNTGLDDIAEYHGLKATGRSETHAGITGEVFVMSYTTKGGKREEQEVVLAKNKTLVEMTDAMTLMSETMAEAMNNKIKETPGARAMVEEFKRKNVGMLRSGNDFRLVSLDTSTPGSARFKLPAEPTQMPAMPEGMFGEGGLGALFGGEAAAETDADGNPVADKVDEKVERQKQRVGNRAEQETDAATDRAVDKVLNKAFDKLFGN